jgi:hypothetical protein
VNYEHYRGVSQGMPTSPLLASLILAPNLASRSVEMLLYADDGILFSYENTIQLPIIPAETGISFNHSKSGEIKTHNTWHTSLKFLGLTYKPGGKTSDVSTSIHGGTLTTSTRTPKEFTLSKLNAFIEAGYSPSYEGHISHTFDKWLETKISGYLQSRLYAGRYDAENLIQDFSFSYEHHSWSSLEETRHSNPHPYILNSSSDIPPLTVFNSSSFANLSLCRWLRYKCPLVKPW